MEKIETIETLSKKIETNPNDFNLYWLRAKLFIRNKKYLEASYDYEKAIKLNSNNFDLLIDQASLFKIMKNDYKMMSIYDSLIWKFPNEWLPYYLKGEIYYNNKQYKSAIKYLEKSSSIKSFNAICDEKLADCYRHINNKREEKEYDKQDRMPLGKKISIIFLGTLLFLGILFSIIVAATK